MVNNAHKKGMHHMPTGSLDSVFYFRDLVNAGEMGGKLSDYRRGKWDREITLVTSVE